ncbi:hypothetical protein BJ138DRAFT_999464 [Hygrophoropsis aurantiaca]|uniref:Uncharacterized protein n=1 Tax=Hygrophoropsis aurantiaca TaxID=72124 RepID=A0ACB8ANX3_9AGAM|nr:hypothetical protein BJ138DRAFT_999464 [Hygrophoropsis aurantiaca]
MFTVKATYRSETRKIVFAEKTSFPTYDELYHQLYRVFPISHNYYFSKLLFSPDASKASRILIGKEVHSAEEYNTCVTPLRRSWPNALLRFSIFDETPHKVPGAASDRLRVPGSFTPVVPPNALSGGRKLNSHSNAFATEALRSVLPSHIPPPPIILSAAPFQSTQFSSRFDPNTTNSSIQSRKSPQLHCCSVEKGKSEIASLVQNFKGDLDRILQQALGPQSNCDTNSLHDSSVTQTPKASPPQLESYQPVYIPSSVNPHNWCFVCRTSFTGFWYGCVKCAWHAVCSDCFNKSGPTHTFSFGPSHVVTKRSPGGLASLTSAPICAPRNQTPATPMGISEASPVTVERNVTAEHSAKPVVHRGVICDKCDKIIVGIKHKCMDCPDYDLCAPCLGSGSAEAHNPFHEFFDIDTPGQMFVQAVFSGHGEREVPSQDRHNISVNRSDDTRQATRTGGSRGGEATPVVHDATCNLCDSRITGKRYILMHALLASSGWSPILLIVGSNELDRITPEHHPNHGFVIVRKAEDLMMRNSLATDGMTHYATCNSCKATIAGVRYKCMHPSCPDFDLCGHCEALPIAVHPPIHPMLKMKTPDTVVPTVYRVGRTPLINHSREVQPEPQTPRHNSDHPGPACELHSVRDSPLPSAIQLPISPVQSSAPYKAIPLPNSPSSVAESPRRSSIGTFTHSDSNLSTASFGVSSPPLALDSTRDVSQPSWPVNQEMIHLTEPQVQLQSDDKTSSSDTITSRTDLDHLNVETKLVDIESPLIKEALLATPDAFIPSEMIQRDMTPLVSISHTLSALLNGSYMPAPVNLETDIKQDDHVGTEANEEVKHNLSSALVADTTVPGGQVFPPGAEFVKSWRMLNDGTNAWPETTELHFVAGESFTPELSTKLTASVGRVESGEELDVWTAELKAPEAPGRYVGYWRLNDGQSRNFGSSVWIDVTVADQSSDTISEVSLASSSVVMPGAASNRSLTPSVIADHAQLPLVPSSSISKPTTDEEDTISSDGSSVSLVSVPSSADDDDSAIWQESRSQVEPSEYVVLYDSNSSEEE